jgi:Ca2+-binding EF-hand superfamily protein
MFAARGKKKLLVELHRAKNAGYEDPMEYVKEHVHDLGSLDYLLNAGDRDKKRRPKLAEFETEKPVAVIDAAKTATITAMMVGEPNERSCIRKIMEATSYYRPERDSESLRAFDSRGMETARFRKLAKALLQLRLTEEEFGTLMKHLDPLETGMLDSSQFMVMFVKLNTMRQERETQVNKQKQIELEKQRSGEEERKRVALETKYSEEVEMDYDKNDVEQAMRKVAASAYCFDPHNTSAPNLDLFAGTRMKVPVFRQKLKTIFNLKFSGREFGAFVKTLQILDGESGEILCGEFLRNFLQLGYKARDKERMRARRRTELDQQAADEERMAKLKFIEENQTTLIDYDYSEIDSARAMEKLINAAAMYDKSSSTAVSLEGFGCASLSAGAFREILRRTFDLNFSNKEIGSLVRAYDIHNEGRIDCANFIAIFLRMGQDERSAMWQERVRKNREAEEAAGRKERLRKEAADRKAQLKVNYSFEEADRASIVAKLTDVSASYNKDTSNPLAYFECQSLTAGEFHNALLRTFNMYLRPQELGALMHELDPAGKQEKGTVSCKAFLTYFFPLGIAEREKRRQKMLAKNRAGIEKVREQNAKYAAGGMGNKLLEVDFSFDEYDRDSALSKLTECAKVYDKTAGLQPSLESFQFAVLKPGEFRDLARRVLGLSLSTREAGALIYHFVSGDDFDMNDYDRPPIDINGIEFSFLFIQLGVAERTRLRKLAMDKNRHNAQLQELEEKERVEADAKKLEVVTVVNEEFTKEEYNSIDTKLRVAAGGYERNNPTAPKLYAFDAIYLNSGQFKEALRRTFAIHCNPGELGAAIKIFDGTKEQGVHCASFLKKFFEFGVKFRFDKHKKVIEEQRRLKKAEREKAQQEEDRKAVELMKCVNWDFDSEDLIAALEKMRIAATGFDKTSSSAPSIAAFDAGSLSPYMFRELLKRTFGMVLAPRELAAMVKEFPANADGTRVNPAPFLVKFIKMGQDERERNRAQAQLLQRAALESVERKRLRKQRLKQASDELYIDHTYAEDDEVNALEKLKKVSAQFDRTASNCPSLAAFDAAYLDPVTAREVIRRVMNVNMTPTELAATIAANPDGKGNLKCSTFLTGFLKMGSEERAKAKAVELEKQREKEKYRKAEEDRKRIEAEQKNVLSITKDFSVEERENAFKKIAEAARKYDKNHPSCVSLSGFDVVVLTPAEFKELMKRTFNVNFSPGELAAAFTHFDPYKSGKLISKEFVSHFLKVGVAERSKDRMYALKASTQAKARREREAEDRLVAAEAKLEAEINWDYTEADSESATRKLTLRAEAHDSTSQGAADLSTFETGCMSAMEFRDKLKKVLGVSLSDTEAAAVCKLFDKKNNRMVDCIEFLNFFLQISFRKKTQDRLSRLQKQRQMRVREEKQKEAKRRAAEKKMEIDLDTEFSQKDFECGMNKIRKVAGSYEPGHPSAPNLNGFSGNTLTGAEFREMMLRTFNVSLNAKQVVALLKFFDKKDRGVVECAEFLAYFFSLVREEQSKKWTAEMARRKEAQQQEKMHADKVAGVGAGAAGTPPLASAGGDNETRTYTEDDEWSFLGKIRNAAELFAVDSASYFDRMRPLKSGVFDAKTFREMFYNVFAVRFSYPEINVLTSILDMGGGATIDGTRFVTWFYKLSRQEERILLGALPDNITVNDIRINYDRNIDDNAHTAVKPKTRKTKPKVKLSASVESGVMMPSAASAAAARIKPSGLDDDGDLVGGSSPTATGMPTGSRQSQKDTPLAETLFGVPSSKWFHDAKTAEVENVLRKTNSQIIRESKEKKQAQLKQRSRSGSPVGKLGAQPQQHYSRAGSPGTGVGNVGRGGTAGARALSPLGTSALFAPKTSIIMDNHLEMALEEPEADAMENLKAIDSAKGLMALAELIQRAEYDPYDEQEPAEKETKATANLSAGLQGQSRHAVTASKGRRGRGELGTGNEAEGESEADGGLIQPDVLFDRIIASASGHTLDGALGGAAADGTIGTQGAEGKDAVNGAGAQIQTEGTAGSLSTSISGPTLPTMGPSLELGEGSSVSDEKERERQAALANMPKPQLLMLPSSDRRGKIGFSVDTSRKESKGTAPGADEAPSENAVASAERSTTLQPSEEATPATSGMSDMHTIAGKSQSPAAPDDVAAPQEEAKPQPNKPTDGSIDGGAQATANGPLNRLPVAVSKAPISKAKTITAKTLTSRLRKPAGSAGTIDKRSRGSFEAIAKPRAAARGSQASNTKKTSTIANANANARGSTGATRASKKDVDRSRSSMGAGSPADGDDGESERGCETEAQQAGFLFPMLLSAAVPVFSMRPVDLDEDDGDGDEEFGGRSSTAAAAAMEG